MVFSWLWRTVMGGGEEPEEKKKPEVATNGPISNGGTAVTATPPTKKKPATKKSPATESSEKKKRSSAKKKSPTKKRPAEPIAAKTSTSKKPRTSTAGSMVSMKQTLETVAPAVAQAAYSLGNHHGYYTTAAYPPNGLPAAGSLATTQAGIRPAPPPAVKQAARTRMSFKDFDPLYERLKVFYAINGHCNVPVHYEADPQLSGWVKSLRRKYKGYCKKPRPVVKGSLTDAQVEKLNALGFQWTGQRGRPSGAMTARKK